MNEQIRVGYTFTVMRRRGGKFWVYLQVDGSTRKRRQICCPDPGFDTENEAWEWLRQGWPDLYIISPGGGQRRGRGYPDIREMEE